MRKLRRIVLVAAMAVFSCSSPTLPLPPPALPSIALGVEASTFVTYSLSTDPASEHYDDYTRLYSTKQWVKAAFTEAEVAADTKSTLELSQ